jgi:protein-S-isoprenylcysteine O-methyltransferase Ste14
MRRMAMRRGALFVTVVPMVAVIAILIRFAELPRSATRVAGAALMIVGFGLLTVARINLGNSFSVAPRATELVTTGIYAGIRNPIYVFSTIGLTGIFLYIDKPIVLLILVPLIALQTWRARAESRLLEEKFGDAYRRYKASTWF